jgi:hypothetical protein
VTAPIVRSGRGSTEERAESSQQLWPVTSGWAARTQNLQSRSELQAAQQEAWVMFLRPFGQLGVRDGLTASTPCCTLLHVSLWRKGVSDGGKREWGGNSVAPAVKRSS